MPVDASNPPTVAERMDVDMMHTERVPAPSRTAHDWLVLNETLLIVYGRQLRDLERPHLSAVPRGIILRVAKEPPAILEHAAPWSCPMRVRNDNRAAGVLDPVPFEVLGVVEAEAVIAAWVTDREHPPAGVMVDERGVGIGLANEEVAY